MGRSTYGTSVEPATIQQIVDIQLKYGMMTAPIDPSDLIWKGPHA